MFRSTLCWSDLVHRRQYQAIPMARYLYPPGSPRLWFNRTKFFLRSLLYRHELVALYRLFSQPALCQLAERYPELLDKPLRPYQYAQTSAYECCRILCEHYGILLERNSGLLEPLYLRDGLTLGMLPGGKVRILLRYESTFRREGELAVCLNGSDGLRLYACAFSLCRRAEGIGMRIGAVQGPEAGVTDATECIRHLTHACHGIRPRTLVVMLTLMLAAAFGVTTVLAVRNAAHVFRARRYSQKQKSRVQIDYDELWEEFGASGGDAFFIQLTLPPRRPLERIPSRKRAMYRRRYEWLDEVACRMARLLVQS